MSSRRGRAFRAEQEALARARQQQAQRQSDSSSDPDYSTPSSFYGASEGLSASISGWLNSNKGNKAVGAAGADLFYNSATAALKQDSDVNYAKAMMPHALDYQRESQKIASAAQKEEIETQGKVDFERQKYISDTALTGQREGYQSQEKQIGLQGDEERKTKLTLSADARGAIRDRGRTLFA